MNNKGFISISVVYSFFIVFLLLLLFIVNGLINNRVLLNNLKKEIKNEISINNFARYIINESKENDTIINHNMYIKNSAKDNSYRYVGSNPNNWLCLGSNVEPCPDTNLYRIIGVFGSKVKIIKNASLGTIKFDDTNNMYYSSYLKDYLNKEEATPTLGSTVEPEPTYLESLGDDAKKIAKTSFYINGILLEDVTKDIKSIYEKEISENIYNTKVALPYVSDYLYATSEEYNNPTSTNNWLNYADMLFFTKVSNEGSTDIYYLNEGSISHSPSNAPHNIYPTFYLNGSIKYESGTGEINKPYRVG